MHRGLMIAIAVALALAVGYLGFSRWAIRHDEVMLFDALRGRPIAVEIAVRRDAEMQAEAGIRVLPVAIVNHGNTVGHTEYSFLTNVLALRGYLVLSIQHDLPTDAPLVTRVGEVYVGRLPIYERGVANILYTVDEMRKRLTYADYDKILLVGHSNGGDISMFFARQHPDLVKRVVTLDNLRVPFLTAAKFKILSFRSKDANFFPDPGVVPDDDECLRSGIEVIKTGARHTDMSDRGPDEVKEKIEDALDQFLSEESDLRAVPGEQLLLPAVKARPAEPSQSRHAAIAISRYAVP